MTTVPFKDPTKSEMLQYLKKAFHGLLDVESDDAFGYDAEIAMYWYASDYHSGQDSNLYGVLCNSDYSPNGHTYENEDDSVHLLYDALEGEFGKEYICPECGTILNSEMKEVIGKTLISIRKCHNCEYEEEI
jgi:hypothetical protein